MITTTIQIPFWQRVRNQLYVKSNPGNQLERLIHIKPGEVRTLPARQHQIQVYSGGAWISTHGEDILLYEGDMLNMPQPHDSVTVVSALGQEPLVLELLD